MNPFNILNIPHQLVQYCPVWTPVMVPLQVQPLVPSGEECVASVTGVV